MQEIRRKRAVFWLGDGTPVGAEGNSERPFPLQKQRRGPGRPRLIDRCPATLLEVVDLGRLHWGGAEFTRLHGNDRVLPLPAVYP